MSKYIDTGNTRTADQKEFYNKIETEGVDPFEMEYFIAHNPPPIFYENDSWFVAKNNFPYKGTSLHILLIHKDFITSIEEISGQGWSDLQKTIKFCVENFNLTSGSFFMRFGDTKKTGSSVTHLHAHILVSDGEPEERRSMYVAVAKPE